MATSNSPHPPPYSQTVLPKTIGATTPFAVLAILFYSARIYTRLRLGLRLRWEDHFMTFAIASYNLFRVHWDKINLVSGMRASNMVN